MPHFFIQVEPARLRFSNDHPLAQSAQAMPVSLMQILEAHRV